jgi:NAD(P)-dependent dehydrogenase (short-subunit alcohol dehydrogenase family)
VIPSFCAASPCLETPPAPSFAAARDNRAMRELGARVAVVTGAASGIGLAVVEAFVAERMRVVMADLDDDRLQAEAGRLGRAGGEVSALRVDVTDPDDVERSGALAVERYGGLHVAVNNAGIVNRGHAWELSLEEWRRVLDVDLWGVIHGVRTYVPLILATGDEGHIVNVASMAAVSPLSRLGPYTVAKHGVLGLTDVLAAEFASLGVPVGASVVLPGMVRTGMNPIGTIEPSVVAANVVDAIRRGRRYVFTDDQNAADVADRLQAIVAARDEVVGPGA